MNRVDHDPEASPPLKVAYLAVFLTVGGTLDLTDDGYIRGCSMAKSKELLKLEKIFKNIADDKRQVVDKLISNAAFMAEQLDNLQADIKEKGYISEYQNGENQWGTKKSPEVEIYNTMIKNYMGIIKQLTDLLPDDSKDEADELMEFVGRGVK